jgi:2,3-bisphosphoglycerate-independent phosphoglycerate mutase
MSFQNNANPHFKKTAILCILDGFGYNPSNEFNAIAKAKTPTIDSWKNKYAHSLIGTDGPHVGLPVGQMGNSEVGHMNIGAGRVALPEFGRIDAMLGDGSMKENIVLKQLIESVKQTTNICHILGLLSDGGVHSHQDQMVGFAKLLADAGIRVFVHAFTDGRDTAPKSAIQFIEKFIADCAGYDNAITIATLSGRFYAMDRDNRWERVQLAYDAMINAKGKHANTALDAVRDAYECQETDEFITPYVIGDYHGMNDGDAFLMANFRSDRVRQILSSMVVPNFQQFERNKIIQFSATAGAVKYSTELLNYVPAMVTPLPYPDGLGEHVSKLGLKQLRIAETEKYAHVTFFFNGGSETIFSGEDRILVPSPKVRTYDEKPEMSAFEVCDKLVEVIEKNDYDVIIVNFANADMVGHTGIEQAAVCAIETLDACMNKLEKALEKSGGFMLVTADHGNAEQMVNPTTQMPHTQHTTFPVPLYLVDPCGFFKDVELVDGKLADLAPTMLELKGIVKPDSMTGVSVVRHSNKNKTSS